MSSTTALLLGLGLGLALGALLAWLLLRARIGAGQDATARAAEQLLALADERYARDAAQRQAAEAARDGSLTRTLAPITASLSHLERTMARTDQARAEAEGALQQHLQLLSSRTEQLTSGTSALTAALRAPTSRGRWGEVQLRRIVEAAGMLEHVDFSEQVRSSRADGTAQQRPDLVVHLAGERSIMVDAKAPMDAYLDAIDQPDEATARRHLAAHAKALRGHVDRLSGKKYWADGTDTPEFTVLFVPSDGVVAAALEADPDLLEHAFARSVVIASPATLVALLRTVAHTWRTDALNRDARQVLASGRELHARLATMSGHFAKLGRQLDGSVKAFNDTVGSYQARVMPSVRRLEELQSAVSALEDSEPVTMRSRPVAATTPAPTPTGQDSPLTGEALFDDERDAAFLTADEARQQDPPGDARSA